MDLKELFTEDRGVSPVIGVILMVAITVILAAVIGAFVLGLGDQASESAPQASIGFAFEGENNVTLSHEGGENIQTSDIEVRVGSTPIFNSSDDIPDTDDTDGNDWSGDTIRTGDSIKFVELDDSDTGTFDIPTSGETVRVIWNNPSGGSSNTIADRTWP